MDFRYLARYQPQLLAILRIVVGLLFLEHGIQKFSAFPRRFRSIHCRQCWSWPEQSSWLAAS
jgi:uncharacterized membrane protein YphA (DoxX/SURF4 family)